MDFFARQEQTRRTSRVLVGAFLASFLVCALATTFAISLALRYANPGYLYVGPGGWFQWAAANLFPLGWITAVTLAIMVAASLFRAASLAGGGGDVARMMHATQVTGGGADPLQQRLVNVVEEMALAAGVAVPEIFVLEHEAGINAFAAGTNHSNAAICVTRGALERLDRAELQGVIAHEFSHILNGDMRLNQQLIGLSFGILALSLVGRAILRGTRFARPNRKDGSALAIAVLIGIALVIIGWLGVFFSRLIKAGVSRQREALADASAVQFTREPQGLAGALKKVAAYGARILYAETEEVAHMLFEHGPGAFAGWFATHPPLIERIRALDPTFDPRDLPKPQPLPGPGAAVAAERAIEAARAEGGFDAMARTAAAVGAALATMPSADDPVRERAGQIATPEVGGALRGAVPEEIQQAARATDSSLVLVAALAVAPDAPTRDRQLGLIENQLGHARALDCRRLYESVNRVDRRYRLAIVALALPALKRRPAEQIRYILDLVGRIAALESEPRLFDYVLLHVLAAYLRAQPAAAPVLAPRTTLTALRGAVRTLLATVAAFGNADAAGARDAYSAGLAAIGWPDAGDAPAFDSPATRDLAKLDEALAALAGLRPSDKLTVLRGALAAIRADGKVELDEQELFRAIAATLDCPLPPGFAL